MLYKIFMKIVPILIKKKKIQPVNSDVLVDLKDIENPVYNPSPILSLKQVKINSGYTNQIRKYIQSIRIVTVGKTFFQY